MEQEIEIEYKNLLTEDEFIRLKNTLPFPEYSQTQTNYYFDTKDFALKAHGCALRIREKDREYRLTLKEPHTDGLLETHDKMSMQEATNWMEGQIRPKPNTEKQLKEKGLSTENLIYFGSLTTERRQVEYKGVLLVLDHSIFNGKEDYELELEAPSQKIGSKMFQTILEAYDIRKKDTPNKIRRFFDTLQK
ncbi:CYTH domain-containing protein [Virgibacillus ainsalahensis]